VLDPLADDLGVLDPLADDLGLEDDLADDLALEDDGLLELLEGLAFDFDGLACDLV